MNNFRLVTLDYPKNLVGNETAMKLFIDMIRSKQAGFERTDKNLVTMDSLDAISTHILIYDTQDIFTPKPVAAMRICYENRTKRHNQLLPIEKYSKALPPEGIQRLATFKENKPILVDCNAWFVDPGYTFSKSGLALSDLAFFSTILFIMRKKFNHVAGCTNERYKASRWANHIGNIVEPVMFIHPSVPDPHRLMLIDGFSQDWLLQCFDKYRGIINNIFEVTPKAVFIEEPLLSVNDVYEKLKMGDRQTWTAA